MIDLISSLDKALSRRAFSTFNIFPFSGSMAWNLLSLPCLADPPALSPSTINISQRDGSFSEQSASFPGRVESSKKDFLLTKSLAFFAASRASERSFYSFFYYKS